MLANSRKLPPSTYTHTPPPHQHHAPSRQSTLPINPHALNTHLLRRPMIVEQALRNMHQPLLLDAKISLQMLEQVVEILQIRLVAPDILGCVDRVEMTACQRTLERLRKGSAVYVR